MISDTITYERMDIQTTQTQMIWNVQNPANLKKWDLISSNLVSEPVFNTRKSRKPASLADQSMTNTEALVISQSLTDSDSEGTYTMFLAW
jgi:hypothetical protein